MQHMPDTPCVRTYALVHGQADCALWDPTHCSQFIGTVFQNNESVIRVSTHTRGYNNLHPNVLRCSSKYRLSLQHTHSQIVRHPGHLKLDFFTNGVYSLFACVCVCVWCEALFFAFLLAPAICATFLSTLEHLVSTLLLKIWTVRTSSSSLFKYPLLEYPVSLSRLETSYANKCGHSWLSTDAAIPSTVGILILARVLSRSACHFSLDFLVCVALARSVVASLIDLKLIRIAWKLILSSSASRVLYSSSTVMWQLVLWTCQVFSADGLKHLSVCQLLYEVGMRWFFLGYVLDCFHPLLMPLYFSQRNSLMVFTDLPRPKTSLSCFFMNANAFSSPFGRPRHSVMTNSCWCCLLHAVLSFWLMYLHCCGGRLVVRDRLIILSES